MKKMNAWSLIWFFAAIQTANCPLLTKEYQEPLPVLMQLLISSLFTGLAAVLFFIGVKEATRD